MLKELVKSLKESGSGMRRGEGGSGERGEIYIYIYICIYMAHLHCCMAETNTTL